MGKWNSRRRFYRRRAPESPPRYSLAERLPDFRDDGVPLWEKKFCTVVGRVPWRQIVDIKKSMQYSYGNVLSWDDSAGEQAFKNAKSLYWAKINCNSSDISLPDPDMYIDEINWNPDIDLELIKDLEREYFAPDDGDKESDEEHKNKRIRNSLSLPSEESDGNPWKVDNPWVCNNNTHNTAALKDKDGWGKWDDEIQDSRNVKNNGDPWEYNCTQNEVIKHDTWGDCCDDKRWGSNNCGSHVNQSRTWGNADISCKSNYQDGWGSWINDSWGWNQQEQNKLDNEGNPWKSNVVKQSRTFGNKGWRDGDKNTWDSKRQGSHNVWSRSFDSRPTNGGWHGWSGHCRKRRSSYQNGTDHGNLRPRYDYDQTGRYRGGKANKRVSFARLSDEIE